MLAGDNYLCTVGIGSLDQTEVINYVRGVNMPGPLYIGKAGQLAVMGELTLRGYNVAMPEIDKGDDIFVVRDKTGTMWRLQVKRSCGRRHQTSWRYQFRIREKAILTPQSPELHFVFVMRRRRRWRFLVMDRAVLKNYVVNLELGSLNNQYCQVWMTLHDDNRTICSKQNLTNHLEDWDTWPEI